MKNTTPQRTKSPQLTVTQAKIVKAKIKAELTDTPQRQAAISVFPNAKPESAYAMMSRELTKVNV